MSNGYEFPSRRPIPAQPSGPYFCGKPMDSTWKNPKPSSPKLVQDAAQNYAEIPANLDRGQAAFVYISTVLQFSRQILRDLSALDLANLNLMVEAAGEAGRPAERDEIDILVDMVEDELERRGGDTVA
ncbi:hypothetical protein [Neorhizobium sp. LjRoot104]|uniref:hypothetical protein n=1 Tax=Neorhizobium sp. LjRoot104 TaxID=3342254 RepID=UPI003F504A80